MFRSKSVLTWRALTAKILPSFPCRESVSLAAPVTGFGYPHLVFARKQAVAFTKILASWALEQLNAVANVSTTSATHCWICNRSDSAIVFNLKKLLKKKQRNETLNQWSNFIQPLDFVYLFIYLFVVSKSYFLGSKGSAPGLTVLPLSTLGFSTSTHIGFLEVLTTSRLLEILGVKTTPRLFFPRSSIDAADCL